MILISSKNVGDCRQVSIVSVVSAYLASPVIQVRRLAARILAEFLADSPAAIRTMTAAAAAGPSANQIHGQLALLHGLLAGPEPSVAMLEVVKEAVKNMEQWLQHCRHSSFCYLLRWELERIRRQLERREHGPSRVTVDLSLEEILVTADIETAEKQSIDDFNMESSDQNLQRENVQVSELAESREGRSEEAESDQDIEVDERDEDNTGSEESDEHQEMSEDEEGGDVDDSDVPPVVSRIHPGFQNFLLDRQLAPEELAKARRSLSHL
jgi:hypothetical protein